MIRKATVCLLALLFLGPIGGFLTAEDEPSGSEPTYPFPDYHPKTTPDTLTDLSPELDSLVDLLPAPSAANLPILVALLKRLELAAQENPGHWEEGNPLLGARPWEYRPSTEELLACEVGERIARTVASGPGDSISASLSEAGINETAVRYRQFRITHYDVMGSGRFFYVERERMVTVTLPHPDASSR